LAEKYCSGGLSEESKKGGSGTTQGMTE